MMGKKLENKEFIKRLVNKYGNIYDYSKVNYINARTKICLICTKHGEFWKLPNDALKNGCPVCSYIKNGEKRKSNKEEFIEKAKIINDDKYDYSKVEYVKDKIKVCIICPEHGEFWQTPANHLQRHGCPMCRNKNISNKKRSNLNTFIEKSKIIHNCKYNYSKFVYIKNDIKGCIICPIHGEFWQTPKDHLGGHGCKQCNNNQLEAEIRNLLLENNINFKEQYRSQWLGLQSLDFYLPDYKTGIECQGIQHFKSVDFFGGNKSFDNMIRLDKLKQQKCINNNIKLLYYSNLKIDYPYKVFEDKKELIENIRL